ncbi:P-loop containing nucleoside triphosphate hydrolase protein [Plectosphaerella cucumerina]|uniref:DNA 3'-5' helicase n=1 Tax=Plectosphaerella cucumerina TaxID=40658 RepID=A0A8K0TK93_9PEZI|nr:P-loop containing nucleoside triphosphate hydrolase protein [Plectosphaerella cucumerina]
MLSILPSSQTPKMDDEYDSGDDLFDGVDAEELARSSPVVKRSRDDFESPKKSAKKAKTSSSDSPSDQSRIELARRILKDKFGYPAFRHEQEGAIAKVLQGDSSLVVFPTGAGKSLCYQIPAIAFEETDKMTGERGPGDYGITLVVSPLIALMKDQVDALRRRGIAAECLDSTKSWAQMQEVNSLLREGKLRLLYVAPERLNNEGFVETIKHVRGGIRLVGVDEAHCISEWGHSFRPDYLKVARFVKEVNAERVICLTATATPIVAQDICKGFDITEDAVFRTSPYRPNLHLEAVSTASRNDKHDLLLKFLKQHPGSTLIYVTLQKQAEDLATFLKSKKYNAGFFHAGMKPEEKTAVQDDFMSSKIPIVVATIAFGMGIDKADVRNIVHFDLASTVEEYSQQVGRAGRDGKDSHCILYLCPEDFYMKENFARGDLPSRPSLNNLLQAIFSKDVVALNIGDSFIKNHNRQSKEYDIRMSPLAVIYASLELRFNLIRAMTPEYGLYKFEANLKYLNHLRDLATPEAKAILEHAKSARKYTSLEPSRVAEASGVPRGRIVRLLNEIGDRGIIKLQPSGVEQKYRVLKALPRTKADISKLTDKLYADLQMREKQALGRIRQMIDLFATPKCFALSLAEHFGMTLPGGADRCGHCTFCTEGVPLTAPPGPAKVVDHAGIRRVLDATDVRDDPRFLARIAFGIKSPRVGQLGLDKKPAFMSMADHDFDLLLAEFTKACRGKGA